MAARYPRRAKKNYQRYYAKNKTRKNRRGSELLGAQRRRDPGARIRLNFRVRLSTLIRKGGRKRFSISRGVLT
jgi:hypothetical protein